MKLPKLITLVTGAALCVSLWTAPASAEETLNWVEGPKKVGLGQIAELDLDKNFVFLNDKDTKTFEKQNGTMTNNREIGSVFPKDENQNWAVIFEYEESGHVKDDEKDKIDADDLLKSYKKGTEEANKERSESNQLFVDGWDVKPFYDNDIHSLSWSLLGHDSNNEKFVNYNVNVLTREGVISVVLVSDPKNLAADRKVLTSSILPKLQVKAGKRYEEYNSKTDKLAEYGLSGLILGGAGLAVAKKVGLIGLLLVFLKKFGVILVAGLAALWRFLRGKKKKAAAAEQAAEARAAEARAAELTAAGSDGPAADATAQDAATAPGPSVDPSAPADVRTHGGSGADPALEPEHSRSEAAPASESETGRTPLTEEDSLRKPDRPEDPDKSK
ncbi:DUF2167 domain-containing protein [Paenibacillus chitinolyticus]|uniref:DUF2167 domain-containing protein n=1 Tax=Paenibacillus chitinolyticus TaxID=79263 RepID=UPI001C480AB2|nr:DUF2167 domain-containing protein [Paenibacillus chitinolyticus]MBV6717019.1 DUF2167 domain-containing protein [Paenibacillus chitinolyticus]